jgi:predicted nucleic acid-binding Zn ribbon protein
MKNSFENMNFRGKFPTLFHAVNCCDKQAGTVHRPGDDPRKECEECGNARGSNVPYYPT